MEQFWKCNFWTCWPHEKKQMGHRIYLQFENLMEMDKKKHGPY